LNWTILVPRTRSIASANLMQRDEFERGLNTP
jgi:hypothetical protein